MELLSMCRIAHAITSTKHFKFGENCDYFEMFDVASNVSNIWVISWTVNIRTKKPNRYKGIESERAREGERE